MVSYNNSATMMLLLVLSQYANNVAHGQDSTSPAMSPSPTTSAIPSTVQEEGSTYQITGTLQTDTSAPLEMGTGKFYVELGTGSRCVRDCAPAGTANCGGIVENAPWLQMFEDVTDCCTTKLPWIDTAACIGPSIPTPIPTPADMAMLSSSVSDSDSGIAVTPTLSPSPTTTTLSPISAADELNMYFCGASEEDANECGGRWCRGDDDVCPDDQTCFLTTMCNATAMNFTMSPTMSMTPTSSAVPTVDLNPNNTYCSANMFEVPDTTKSCGIPCPSGVSNVSWVAGFELSECPSDKPNCLSRVAYDGTLGCDKNMVSAQWCGRSYKHLAEYCPKPCPGGTDAECGMDVDGVTPMKCFTMTGNKTDVCSEAGVGIKNITDPKNLWCGSDWNNVLETCAKACPEGSDEECGPGLVCYDLTGNDKICTTLGVPVKVKGDPLKRYCGATYNDMMRTCPLACPVGDECEEGQICFEESPCTVVGQMAEGFVELDTTKMFCGVDYEEAATTGDPCPDEQCPDGQTCWGEVERYGEATEDSTEATEEDLEATEEDLEATEEDLEETEEDLEETEEDPEETADEPEELADELEEEGEVNDEVEDDEPEDDVEDSKPESEETDSDSTPAESSEAPPAESSNPPPTEDSPPAESSNAPPAESSNAPPTPAAAASEPATETDSDEDGGNPFESLAATSTSESSQSGIAVDYLRMALFGLPTLSAEQLSVWEDATATYFEEFYNDASFTSDVIRDSVSDVSTEYDVTSLNAAAGRRRLRRTQSESAFLLTFTQTTQYSADDSISIEQVVQHPFSDSSFRDNYVAYLKGVSEPLFDDLTGVSAIMIPVPFNSRVVSVADSSSPSSEGTGSPMSLSIENGAPSSTEETSGGLYGENFYCHNSGEACPAGDCSDGDLCMFVPDGEFSPIAPFSSEATVSNDSAANLVDSALAGSTAPQDDISSAPTPTSPAVSSASSTSTSACNLCRPNQIGINAQIEFNGKLTDCAEAYDYMAKNYKQDAPNCIAAYEALGSTCCRDAGAENVVVPVSSPTGPTSASACNLCGPTQTGINAQIEFNGRLTDCAEAYDYMAKNYKQDAPNCIAAHEALGSTCCQDVGGSTTDLVSVPVSVNSDSVTTTATTTDSNPSGSDVLQFPADSYYCGESMNDASRSCYDACPSSKDSECPGGLKCFGNTKCQDRTSFYCGTSWFDASNKCSKKCPSGDALECDPGEGCFAWTSCAETSSFYCGETFEDANSNCTLPCPSGSDNTCPEGQGCFQYTTCQATLESSSATHESYKPPNDYFCGESKNLASMTCSIACPSGEDSECPGDLKCFDGTGCSIRDSFWCGKTWMDAAETCPQPCSSGSSDDCPDGQSCFTQTGCQANMFFCGDTYDTASCDHPCESRSSDECDGDQKCFAFVTHCAAEGKNVSPLTPSLSSGVANTEWDVDHAIENPPDWQTNWIAETSSSWKRSASLVGILFASWSLLLGFAL